MTELVNHNTLKTFASIATLTAENFNELAGKAYVEGIPIGKALFKKGETDQKTIYLIEGEIALMDTSGKARLVRAGTEAARHPLGHFQPRKHTAIAKTSCKITRFDSGFLDILMHWEKASSVIDVDEIHEDDDDDWMTKMLQSKAFLQVPPANIQAMFMYIEEVAFKAGQTVIKQGSEGDYYYIIKHGKCRVTRNSKSGSLLTLATLQDGDAFGEEALLSEVTRNANVTMLTDGSLMRLSKKDFVKLLKEPMLHWVTRQEGQKMVDSGQAVWLDIRTQKEHKASRLKGSINIPLFMLRLKMDTLDSSKKYILYCNTGKQSSAATFLLSSEGLDAACLKNGLAGIKG